MSTNLKLQTAIHLALGVSAGVMAMAYVPHAYAQDADADANEAEGTLEEVIVTGSRIRRADIDSASPVTVLNRDEMEVTGVTDIGSLLQRMPSMSGSPLGTANNNGNDGQVNIDLRGMQPERTVTLVNGHRLVDGGDYQTIPATMIERVEILKDGASAVYGADAVAGVVNIITRRNFQGMELSAQYADWFDTKNGEQTTIGLIAGTEFDSGNFVFGAEYVDQTEAYQRDVPWEFMQDSYYIYPETCEKHMFLPYDGTPSGGCYRSGSSAIPEGRWNLLTQGRYLIGTPASQPYEVGLMIPHDGRNYNYAPVNYLQTPYKRTNIFAEAHFNLTDNIRFNAEMRGNYRESAQELAPTPYFSVTDPAYDGFWTDPDTGETVAYHGASPDNYYLRRAIDAYNAANGTSLRYEPAVDLRRRMFEQPRRFTQKVTQFQFVAGLEGAISDIDWDVFMNYGYRSQQDHDYGQYVGDRLAKALGPSADLNGDGMPECYEDINDPGTLIAGCVPLNFWGGGTITRETGVPTASTVTRDMFDYISFILNDSQHIQQTIFGGNLTGSLFELPGGALGWAVGAGYWKQEYEYTPDSSKAAGAVTGNKSSPTDGSLTNKAVYVEVLAPVYDNGTQSVNLKAGLRYDDYDAFSGDSTYQLGVEFQALEDVTLRGTYGTVFRAPTIFNLYGGLVDNFPTFSDPCTPKPDGSIAPGCAAEAPGDEGQLLSREGGNPELVPETGNTLTAGLVWTPQFGDHNFSATVDYWEISLDDAISSLGVQNILENCYVNQNENACALVFRRPSDYGIAYVLNGPLNVASQGAKGVDTEIRWNYSSSIGQWQASMLWAHLLERTKKATPDSETDDLSGRYVDSTQNDGGAYPGDKINYSLQWAWNDLSIAYLGEFVSSLDADTFCNCDSDFDPSNNTPDGKYIQKIDSFLYHDLVATYEFGMWGLRLTGGVTNITNEEPPFIETGFNATTDPTVYRQFGRGYYVRAQWKF